MAIVPSDHIYFGGKECTDVTFDGHECVEAWFPVNGTLEKVWEKEQEIQYGNYLWFGKQSISYTTHNNASIVKSSNGSNSVKGALFNSAGTLYANDKYFVAFGPVSTWAKAMLSKDGIKWLTVNSSLLQNVSYCSVVDDGLLLQSTGSNKLIRHIKIADDLSEIISVTEHSTDCVYSMFTNHNYLPIGNLNYNWQTVHLKDRDVVLQEKVIPDSQTIGGYSHTYTGEWLYHRNGTYYLLYVDAWATSRSDRHQVRYVRKSTNLIDWTAPVAVYDGIMGSYYGLTIGGVFETSTGFAIYYTWVAYYSNDNRVVMVTTDKNMSNWSWKFLPDVVYIDSYAKVAILNCKSATVEDGYTSYFGGAPLLFARLNAMYYRGKIRPAKGIVSYATYFGGTFSQGNMVYFLNNFDETVTNKAQAFYADHQDSVQRGDNPPSIPYIDGSLS